MPTDDRQIAVTGQASAPAQWVIPGNGQIAPRAVFAHYDGTGAATVFQPALKVVSDGGKTVGIFPITGSVAAGGSADVSWFPGVVTPVSAGKVAVVGARIEATSTQNVNDSTATDLVYQTVDFDTGGFVNLVANNRILTLPTSGLYMVACETFWAYNSAGRRLTGVFQNGYFSGGAIAVADDSRIGIWAHPVGGDGMGNPHTTNTVVGLIHATAGDFVSSGTTQNSGSTLTANGDATAFLTAILLGTT